MTHTWSLLDPVGQEFAVTFDDEQTARDHVLSWDDPVDELQFLNVETDQDGFASIDECVAAGCERWDPAIDRLAS